MNQTGKPGPSVNLAREPRTGMFATRAEAPAFPAFRPNPPVVVAGDEPKTPKSQQGLPSAHESALAPLQADFNEMRTLNKTPAQAR